MEDAKGGLSILELSIPTIWRNNKQSDEYEG